MNKKTIQVKVVNEQKVDLCGKKKKKEVRFYIYLGKMELKDSLLGYSLRINYDSTVIKMKSFLKTNTLTSFFDYSDYRIVQKEGYIQCSAGQINNFFVPVFGDSPLIAFAGEFIGNCKNNTNVSVDYIDFTEEFQCNLDSLTPYVSANIDAIVQDKPDRKVTFKNLNDTLFTKKDSIVDLNFSLIANIANKIEKMSFDYTIDNTKFEFVNASITNDTLFKISSLNIVNSNYIKFDILKNSNRELQKLNINIKMKSTGYESEFCSNKLSLKSLNECACVTVLDSSIQYIVSTKIVDTKIDENDENIFFKQTSNLIILNDNCIGSKVEIIDYIGNVLYSKYCESSTTIEMKDFSNIVFLRILKEGKVENFKLKFDLK
ncbi:MAG: hypothetical protein NTW25_06875 [Candidatus Kapabacteria bacterium]|nr:hypothetical protein [Candidatus Kapabacteria bacterium]